MNTSLVLSFLIGNAALGVETVAGAQWNIIPYVLIVMACDYFMGLTIGFLNKSPKTESHGLSSSAAFRGLVKKIVIVILIGCGFLLDNLLGFMYIGRVCALSFISSELISILENAVILGVSKPKILLDALDIVKNTTLSVQAKRKLPTSTLTSTPPLGQTGTPDDIKAELDALFGPDGDEYYDDDYDY